MSILSGLENKTEYAIAKLIYGLTRNLTNDAIENFFIDSTNPSFILDTLNELNKYLNQLDTNNTYGGYSSVDWDNRLQDRDIRYIENNYNKGQLIDLCRRMLVYTWGHNEEWKSVIKKERGITDEQINQLRSNVKYYQFLEKYKSNNDQVLSACCKRILILLQYNEYSIELLHTLFVSYFRVKLGITTNENNKPNVLYKQYIASFQSDATKAVLKKNTNIIDKFNNSRNNESLAHDVKKLNVTEEYIIFDEIFNIIICIDNPHTN